jgi:site-specific DNA recombinase
VFNGYRYWDSKSGKEQKAIRVEGTHEALVTREQFEKVREGFKQRGFTVTHPRAVASEYLLSGILCCGVCDAKMIGTTAKSGQFTYYGCQTYLKKGRKACSAGLVNRDRLEGVVIAALESQVLTDENLAELVKLINEEANLNRDTSGKRLAEVAAQTKALNGRLDKLYGALETGHVDMADLGPRIKALRAQIEVTEDRKRTIAAEDMAPLQFSGARVRRSVTDLREVLAEGTTQERKSRMRAWVKRIEVDTTRGGTIEYKVPPFILKAMGRPTEGGPVRSVLSINQIGCGTRIRT